MKMQKFGASGKPYLGRQWPAVKPVVVEEPVLHSSPIPYEPIEENIGTSLVIEPEPETSDETGSSLVIEPEPTKEVEEETPVNSWKAKREKKKLLPYGLKEESSDEKPEAHQS